MKILVIDRNTTYIRRFKHFMSKKYADAGITVFDSMEAFIEEAGGGEYDAVLIDPETEGEFSKENEERFKKAVFAYISETNEIVDDKETIFKYSPLSRIYSRICSLYEKKKNRVIKTVEREDAGEKSCEIITFLPVHGGAGSSTMAAACAIALSEVGETIYINLEQHSSDQMFFHAEGRKSITDVIAVLKTKYTDNAVYQVLKEVISKDTLQQQGSVSFIKGYTNMIESNSLGAQGLETILNMLKEKFNYRYIIIDTDLFVGPMLKKLIQLSDKVTLVSSGSDISNVKLAKIQRYFELIERDTEGEMPEKFLLLNQYYGMNDEKNVVKDMEIIAKLARYRTGEQSRITTQQILNEVGKKDVFSRFKPAVALNV